MLEAKLSFDGTRRGLHAPSFVRCVFVDVMLGRSRADWAAFVGLLSDRSTCKIGYRIH